MARHKLDTLTARVIGHSLSLQCDCGAALYVDMKHSPGRAVYRCTDSGCARHGRVYELPGFQLVAVG